MKRSKCILYVEDNESDLMLMQRIFVKEIDNCKLKHFYDANSCLKWLNEIIITDELPSMILLDLKLVGMNGLDLLQHIRTFKKLKHIPVIMMSSSVEPKDIRKAYENRASSYVEKPKNYVNLKDTVKSIVHYWTDLNKYNYDY
ncbi:response regulator [Aquimarina sp. 2-A2]|uniref:response regulator n=1 Tax=Aquimarina sp. 2-A2 TaxID=3382644 RepID=UPI00387EFB0E